jgi:hypothetical protein
MRAMKLVRAVAPALSILVLAGLLAALAVVPAGAAPKPAFAPKTGTYLGTMTSSVGTGEISGQVGKEGKKYIVQTLLSSTETCENGLRFPGGVSLQVPLKGKSFSATESGSDSYTGGTATYKISGHFTSEKEFTGTASKTSAEGPKQPGSGTCSTGTMKFTLKFKTSKPLVQ